MILIWKGAGILVAVIGLVAICTGDKLAEALFGPQASPSIHNLTVQWLAAALTLVLALLLRIPRSIGIDPQTGAEVVIRPNHSLFWIPVIVWPIIFFILGIVVYYRTPTPAPALFEVTPAAAAKIKQQAAAKSLPRGWYVRLEAYCQRGVDAPLYSLEIVTTVDPARDYEFKASGIKIAVLKRQVEMLRGAQLDVGEQDGEVKFRVNNPNLEGEQLEKWRRDLELERPSLPKP
jgi:Fe-S cluster assembly iron-binding protein IscA